MDWRLYIGLSVMMFLEFAIWGAWSPVLASHLVGPLKLSGKQTGWIYATLRLGCIISPFIGGQIADRWAATEQFLAFVHLAGAIVLLLAARQLRFWPLFVLMFVYSLLYAPTLALVNSLMFAHLTNTGTQAGSIRVWGTIGWIVAGLLLALWRNLDKPVIKGIDSLTLAGILSLLMGLFCFLLPHTPPPEKPASPFAFVDAFKMLADTNFLVFLIISFLVATQLQFYFVSTAPFFESLGVRSKNVSAVMTLAQFSEILAMAVLLPYLLPKIGFRWALALGAIAWPLRYVIFALMKPLWLVIGSLMFHGIGYTFFIFVGTMYVDSVAPPDIRASAQALIAVVTLGLGNFIGTQVTGIVMDLFRSQDGFRWRPIFLVPCALTIACAVAFVVLFKG